MVLRDGAAIILAVLVYHWVTKGHLRFWEGIRDEVRARRREAEVANHRPVEGNVLETAVRSPFFHMPNLTRHLLTLRYRPVNQARCRPKMAPPALPLTTCATPR